jgi:hypothetical protein
MLDLGEITLTQLETWIFGLWKTPLRSQTLEFLDVDPPSGG